MNKPKLYDKVVELSIEHDRHESDLYLPVNEQTRALINEYHAEFKANVTTFKNQIDGTLWYDIPFTYMPFWRSKTKAEGKPHAS